MSSKGATGGRRATWDGACWGWACGICHGGVCGKYGPCCMVIQFYHGWCLVALAAWHGTLAWEGYWYAGRLLCVACRSVL